MDSIGSFLKRLRLDNGYTLRVVEDSIGISNAYLSQLENGKIKKPSGEVLNKLAIFYGVKVEVLLNDTGAAEKTITERVYELEQKIAGMEDELTGLRKLFSVLPVQLGEVKFTQKVFVQNEEL